MSDLTGPDWFKKLQPGPQCNTVEGADGRFGFDRTNPIPTDGNWYCKRLRCPRDHPYYYHRLGSVGSGPDGHILDCMQLICFGRESRVELFFDMYHHGASTFIPGGLEFGAPEGAGTTQGMVSDFPDHFERAIRDNREASGPQAWREARQEAFDHAVATESKLQAGGIDRPVSRRLGAFLIDNAVVWGLWLIAQPVILFPIYSAVPVGTYRLDSDLHFWLSTGIAAAVAIAYYWLATEKWGRTLGKKIMGIRITGLNGGRPSQRACLVRAVAQWMLPPALSLVWWSSIGPRDKSAHDFLSGTRMLYEPAGSMAPLASGAHDLFRVVYQLGFMAAVIVYGITTWWQVGDHLPFSLVEALNPLMYFEILLSFLVVSPLFWISVAVIAVGWVGLQKTGLAASGQR